jgi:hypothetical protein
MKMNPLLDAALKYRDMGFSVIPVMPGEKKPLIKWESFQKTKADVKMITSWWSRTPNANVGIVTGKISNLFVVDLDKYKDQYDDELSMQFFPDSLITPSASTPQEGEHLYFSYPDNFEISGRADEEIAIDFRAEGNFIVAPPSMNGNGRLYQWRNSIFDTALSFVPNPYLEYIKEYISTYKGGVDTSFSGSLQGQHLSTNDYKMFREGRRDQDLFHIANQLVLSKTPIEEISQVIRILAKNCNPPFPDGEIDAKIISALRRGEKRDSSLAHEIKEWVCLQDGTINLQTVYNCLQVSTRQDRKNVSIILKRLSEGEDRILEKISGGATGTYKTINRNLKKINLNDRSDLRGELDIKFPFGMENLIKPMPKCVYIIAGETDAGKSAFLMNFANVENHVVHYFSTEMGKQEFLDRTDYFWPEAPDCQNLNFYEHYEDFDQVIFPDDINIIDYLELFDNFYLMAGFIKKIGKALRNGVAFIALQKPRGREEGEGGERTKNLPRLYLSLAPNVLKIVKAKNWRNPKMNPNRMEIEFKLIDGCKFTNTNHWKRKE